MISKELIIELQKIIREEYGREMSLADVEALGNDLVAIFDVLAKIDFKNKACKK